MAPRKSKKGKEVTDKTDINTDGKEVASSGPNDNRKIVNKKDIREIIIDSEITFNEKSPAKIGRISSKDLKEAGSSKGKNTSRNNVFCTMASFQEDEDHIDMEVDRIDEEFLSESESSDDDSVKIVVTKKKLDQWRQSNRKKD